jgi:hypothetical protein
MSNIEIKKREKLVERAVFMIGISQIFPSSLTLFGIIALVIGLIILWVIISIPVWLAGKAVTGGKATFGEAMGATLLGPIVYVIVLFIVDFFLGAVIGHTAFVFAYILAFIAWIWVFKMSFRTGWLAGLGIAILAVIILIVLNIIIGALFGLLLPGFFFPTF